MKIKYMTILLCVLMSFSLISFGFASWIITGSDITSLNGFVNTEQVMKSDECIAILNENDITLKYSPTGFVDENNFITNVGVISIKYRIDLNQCKNYFAENYNSLVVTLSLESNYAGYKIFETISSSLNGTIVQETTDEIIIEGYAVSNKNVYGKNNNTYIISFMINNLLNTVDSELIITVNYKFIVNLYHYEAEIYKHLKDISFTTSAMVNGDNYE